MKLKTTTLVIICVAITAAVVASGCIFWNSGSQSQGHPTTEPTPTAYITPEPRPSGSVLPTQWPVVQPGSPGDAQNGTETVTPVPTQTGPVVTSAELASYGTDKNTYSRGDTAIGYIDVKNTGTAIIDRVDYSITVYKAIFGYYASVKSADYSSSSLGIQPGDTKRIQFSVAIPAEYQGISTAGDYRFDVVVKVADKQIGSFSKNVKVT